MEIREISSQQWGASGESVLMKNNLCNGNDVDYYAPYGSGAFDANSVANISQDTTSPNATLRSRTAAFVSTVSGSEDLHLAASDTAARNQGVNLSADPYLAFSDDIDGQPRPIGSNWNIGTDEYSEERFDYRKQITISDGMTPSGSCSGNLSSFPVLIDTRNWLAVKPWARARGPGVELPHIEKGVVRHGNSVQVGDEGPGGRLHQAVAGLEGQSWEALAVERAGLVEVAHYFRQGLFALPQDRQVEGRIE